MEDDVREQIERRAEVLGQRQRRSWVASIVGRRRERSAEARDFVSDRERVARRRALVQHRGGEVRETRPGQRVGVAADRDDQLAATPPGAPPLDEDHRQPVREPERLGGRQLRGRAAPASAARFRHGSSTLIPGAEACSHAAVGFARSAARRAAAVRRRQLLLAGHRKTHDALVVLQVLARRTP